MTPSDLDYPVAAPGDVDPRIFRAQLIQTMALRYMRAVPDLSLDEAMESAVATWETDWDDDPAPRTMTAAIEAVDSDLEYWVMTDDPF